MTPFKKALSIRNKNIKKQYKKLRKQKNQYDCLYAIADMYGLAPETIRDILWRRWYKMSFSKRGKRNGTGPYKGSWQRKKSGGTGKRRKAGQKCPKK